MLKYKVINVHTLKVFFFHDVADIYEKLEKIYAHKNEDFNKQDFTINENKCFGCLNDKLDQRSHMDCPEGCLHNKKECELCS